MFYRQIIYTNLWIHAIIQQIFFLFFTIFTLKLAQLSFRKSRSFKRSVLFYRTLLNFPINLIVRKISYTIFTLFALYTHILFRRRHYYFFHQNAQITEKFFVFSLLFFPLAVTQFLHRKFPRLNRFSLLFSLVYINIKSNMKKIYNLHEPFADFFQF